MMTFSILILGGTTEARELAGRLAARPDLSVRLSLAGRTANPVPQPVPVRTGGFGGAAGLRQHLADHRIDLLIDATHPFATQISANAATASKAANVPLLVMRRAEWVAGAGDDWIPVDTIADAATGLGASPRRVFVTLGRQELAPLQAAPQHFYLIRSVDPVVPPLDVPHAEYVLDRGPFALDAEIALLKRWRIDVILSKNSGGAAAYTKLVAARRLGVPVLLVRRPAGRAGEAVESVDAAVARVDHLARPGEERGE